MNKYINQRNLPVHQVNEGLILAFCVLNILDYSKIIPFSNIVTEIESSVVFTLLQASAFLFFYVVVFKEFKDKTVAILKSQIRANTDNFENKKEKVEETDCYDQNFEF